MHHVFRMRAPCVLWSPVRSTHASPPLPHQTRAGPPLPAAAVGQEFLRVLHERDFPYSDIKMLASARSAGRKYTFEGVEYTVEELDEKRCAGAPQPCCCCYFWAWDGRGRDWWRYGAAGTF